MSLGYICTTLKIWIVEMSMWYWHDIPILLCEQLGIGIFSEMRLVVAVQNNIIICKDDVQWEISKKYNL